MSSVNNQDYDHDALMHFLEDPKALERLVSLTHVTCSEDTSLEKRDQEMDYVADQIVRMAQSINTNTKNLESIDAKISDYMDEERMPEVVNYVLKNAANVPVVDMGNATSSFQDMSMMLNSMVDKQQGEMAKAIMFYGVGLAEYEWKDRRRGGVDYDVDDHGPINFSTLDNGA